MKKRAQVTIFIIFGMVVVAGVLLFVFMGGNGGSQHDSGLRSDDVGRAVDFVEDCVSQELERGMSDIYFEDTSRLEDFLNYNVGECVNDFSALEDLEVVAGVLVFDVELSEDEQYLNINLEYPLEIISMDKTSQVKDFFVKYPLTSQVILDFSSGKTVRDRLLISPDNKFQLKIKEGTIALTKDGSNVEEIRLEVVSKESFKSPYSHVVGNIVYRLEPSGATFSPPLELRYIYDGEMLPNYIEESQMEISFYDENSLGGDYWKTYEGGEVYLSDDMLYADIDHFTDIAPTVKDEDSGNVTYDLDNPPNTCENGEGNVFSPTSWCTTDCNSGSACPGGTVNCDCYGHCGSSGDPGSCFASTDSYICEKVIDSDNTYGFFSLASFNGGLYAGAFGPGHFDESMLFVLDGGRVSPGIKGVRGRVCVMKEFRQKLYANTGDEGKIFESVDGKTWNEVYQAEGVYKRFGSGCGMAISDGFIYASISDMETRRSVIVRSSDGIDWEEVNDSNIYLIDMITYEDRIYGFGFDADGSGWMISSLDGIGWELNSSNSSVFKGSVSKGTLWFGSSTGYNGSEENGSEENGSEKSGIWKIGEDGFMKVYDYEGGKESGVTYIKSWKGNLFAGTTHDFGNRVGPTDLLFSEDGGESWEVACSVPDVAIRDLEVHEDMLFFASGGNENEKGSVYRVSVPEKDNGSVLEVGGPYEVGSDDILIDYGDPGYSETGDSWTDYTFSTVEGGSYRFLSHFENTKSRRGKAVWETTISKDGIYSIETLFRATANRNSKATYFLHENDKEVNSMVVDQRAGIYVEVAGSNKIMSVNFGKYCLSSGDVSKLVLDGTNNEGSDEADSTIWRYEGVCP